MRPRNPMGRIVHSLCFLTDIVSSIRYIPNSINVALAIGHWQLGIGHLGI